MDPISLSIGTAIGLAGLYSVCLQAMEQVSDGKNFAEDSQMFYALFETERYLFHVWGKRVGIEKESDFHRCLDPASPEHPRIRGILKSLEAILSNGDDLLIDKKKFDRLVKDIGTLVEKLSTVASLEEDPRFDIIQSLATLGAALDEADRAKAEETIEQQKHRLKVENYIENQENKETLNWIGAISTEKEYDEAKRERISGTCDWIFSKPEFMNWICPRSGINTSSVLWTYGGAGMGKTFLSARITEYLHQFSRPTAFFFSTHSNAEKNQTMSIVRSWILQLARQSPQALEIVRKSQSSHNEAVTTVLWETFGAVLKNIGSCYLVLDGLDECLDFDPTSRSRRSGEMKIFIKELTDSIPSTGVKLLIMSRDVVAIKSGLEPLRSSNSSIASSVAFEEYQIKREDNIADIKYFASRKSDYLGFGGKDKKVICDKLSERCDGMFLWARLGAERLEAGMESKVLEKMLTEMPPGLDHAYERNLQTILKKDKYYQDRAIAALRLVLFSLRPLSVSELLHALEINYHEEDMEGKTGFEEDTIPSIDLRIDIKSTALLENCGSLLGIRKTEPASQGDWHVQFIHFSAKEYLLDLRSESCSDPRLLQFSFSETEKHHAALTNTCLLYLIIAGMDYRKQTREQSTEDYTDLNTPRKYLELDGHGRKWRFYRYARHGWSKHFHLCGEVRPNYARKIFLDSSPAFDSWKLCLSPKPEIELYARIDLTNVIDRAMGYGVSLWYSRVVASCMFGMLDVLQELLAEAKEKTPPDALPTAIYCRQAAVAEVLIQRDYADLNEPSPYDGVLLLYDANREGMEDTVRLLLGRPDLPVNKSLQLPRRRFPGIWLWPGLRVIVGTVLFYAVCEGDESFVRQLLARDDLDVNCTGTLPSVGCVTPLACAIWRDYVPIVKLLLGRKDTNVNLAFKGWNGQAPLHFAVLGSSESLKLLLARDDILVNKTDDEGRTPLDLATPGTEDFRLIRDKGGKLSSEISPEAEEIHSAGSTQSSPLHGTRPSSPFFSKPQLGLGASTPGPEGGTLLISVGGSSPEACVQQDSLTNEPDSLTNEPGSLTNEPDVLTNELALPPLAPNSTGPTFSRSPAPPAQPPLSAPAATPALAAPPARPPTPSPQSTQSPPSPPASPAGCGPDPLGSITNGQGNGDGNQGPVLAQTGSRNTVLIESGRYFYRGKLASFLLFTLLCGFYLFSYVLL